MLLFKITKITISYILIHQIIIADVYIFSMEILVPGFIIKIKLGINFPLYIDLKTDFEVMRDTL